VLYGVELHIWAIVILNAICIACSAVTIKVA